MAEWSNAPVWKAGLLTEARVQISFAASLLFLFEKKKKCATSQKEKPGVFLRNTPTSVQPDENGCSKSRSLRARITGSIRWCLYSGIAKLSHVF